MFDTLKIENRYTFKNDDELSIKSMSIYGKDQSENEKKENKPLDNIDEEKNGESISSGINTNNGSTNDISEKREISNEQNEESNENYNDNESEVQESIEIIKNEDIQEDELNDNKDKDDDDNRDKNDINKEENNSTDVLNDSHKNKTYKPTIELTDTQYEILENIGNLCNHILSNSASKTLIR